MMTPGFAKTRAELPGLPYPEKDRVIINAHNFSPWKYPTLRTTLPVAGYSAGLDAGAAATDQFTADGSQDGTLTNGATRVDDGGTVYSCDGVNDYIDFGNVSTFNLGNSDFTIAGWLKLPGTYSFIPATVLSKGVTIGFIGWTIQYFTFSGTRYCQFSLHTGGAQREVNYASPVTSFFHFMWRRNGTAIDLFINGSLVSSNTITSGTVNSSAYPMRLGIDGAGARISRVLAEDLLFWNVALADADAGYLASQRGAIYATN